MAKNVNRKPQTADKSSWRYIDDSLKNRMKKNSVTNIAYFILSFPLMFIVTPMILKFVGKEVYGIWAIVGTLLIFVELIGGFQTASAMSVMIPKYNPKKQSNDINEIVNTMFFIYIVTASIIAVVFFLLKSSLIAWFFKIDPALIPMTEFILVFSMVMFLLNFVMLGVGYLLGAFNIFYFTNIIHTVVAYLRAGLIVAALFMGYGIKGVVVVQMGLLIAESIVMLIMTKRIYKPLKIGLKYFSKEKLKTMIVLSLKLFLNRAVVLFNYNVDKLIIGYFINPVIAGYYHIGAGITKYISQVPEMLGLSSLLPAASELRAKNQTDKLIFLYEKVNKYIFFVALFFASGIMIFGKEFIFLWLGKGYESVYTAMVFLSIGYTYALAGYASMHLLNGMERIRETFIVSGVTLVLNLVLSIILTQKYGLIGALSGTVISMIFGGTLLAYLFKRIIGHSINIFNVLLKPLIALVIAFGLIYGLEMIVELKISWIWFFVKAGLFSMIYFVLTVFVFKHIDEYDKEMFLGYFKVFKKK